MPDRPTHRPAHEAHDPVLIASLADDSLPASQRTAAMELAATCPECAELLADLRSIMAATAALPIPARTRDFRLTEEDARRLRPGGWRRLVGFLAGRRRANSRWLICGHRRLCRRVPGRCAQCPGIQQRTRPRPASPRIRVRDRNPGRTGPLPDPLDRSPPLRRLTFRPPRDSRDASAEGPNPAGPGRLRRYTGQAETDPFEACPWNA